LLQTLENNFNQVEFHVDDKYLLFDFNIITTPTEQELDKIEKIVEEKILDCVNSNIFKTNKDHIT
jgi:alanyl-tRNA synthetase